MRVASTSGGLMALPEPEMLIIEAIADRMPPIDFYKKYEHSTPYRSKCGRYFENKVKRSRKRNKVARKSRQTNRG